MRRLGWIVATAMAVAPAIAKADEPAVTTAASADETDDPKDARQHPSEGEGQPTAEAATEPATEQPGTEAVATEQPATEAVATEQPATEQPATEQAATAQPATEQPGMEQPKQSASSPAVAADPRSPVMASNQVQKSAPKQPRKKYFGIGMNIGAPDLIGVSAIFRPVPWVRVFTGLGTNLVNVGIHGGITAIPLLTKVSPSVTIEGGKMFEGDASWLANSFGAGSDVFKKIGYDYANLHGGLEFGSAKGRFQFYVHGGMSYLATTVHNIDSAITSEGGSASNAKVSDVNISLWIPSGKLGFVLYL